MTREQLLPKLSPVLSQQSFSKPGQITCLFPGTTSLDPIVQGSELPKGGRRVLVPGTLGQCQAGALGWEQPRCTEPEWHGYCPTLSPHVHRVQISHQGDNMGIDNLRQKIHCGWGIKACGEQLFLKLRVEADMVKTTACILFIPRRQE